MLVARVLHELAVVGGELQADQQALAADVEHDVRVAVLQAVELLGEVAGQFADVVHQFGLGELLHRGERHGHGQRVAAVGRAVRTDGHAGARRRAGDAGADREAAAEGLGQGHDVRLHAGRPFPGEQLAGAAETALDLVEDQQRAGLVAELAHLLELLVGQGAGAALALHRLDDDRRGGRADGGLQGLHVAERQLDEARHARTETFEIGRVARGVDRRQGAAVERAVEADDVDPLGLALGPVILARGLDRALDRLGAGIGEEHLVQAGGVGQHLGQLFLARDLEDVGDVPELLGLVLHRLHQLGVRVAERVHRDAGHAVEIGLSVRGEQARALASFERQRGAVVDAHDVVAGNGRGLLRGLFSHGDALRKRKRPRGIGGGDWKAWRFPLGTTVCQ